MTRGGFDISELSMVRLKSKNNRYWFSLLSNPLARVLKFERFYDYFLSLPKGKCVLDYGSGDRPYEEMLMSKFDKYIAVDHQPTNIKHNKKPDIYIQGDKLDISTNSIDCVVLTEVMEHLYSPKAVLEELYRVLKPGGKLIGTVPFTVSEHEQPYDFHRYTFFCLQRMFSDTGFKVLKLEYIGDMIAAHITIASRLFGLVPKLFRKMRLHLVANLLGVIPKIPEYVYYCCHKLGLQPQKIGYLKQLPLGFTFYLEKAT